MAEGGAEALQSGPRQRLKPTLELFCHIVLGFKPRLAWQGTKEVPEYKLEAVAPWLRLSAVVVVASAQCRAEARPAFRLGTSSCGRHCLDAGLVQAEKANTEPAIW